MGSKGLGMNTSLGRQQADQLEAQGKKIKAAQKDIDGLMNELRATWFGPDADRYQTKWNTDYSTQLEHAGSRLLKTAGQVCEQAREQDKGSA